MRARSALVAASAAAVAAALDGMDVVLDGRKVGQVITTRQQNDNRAFDQ